MQISLALIIFDNFSPEEFVTCVNDVVVYFELKHGQLYIFSFFFLKEGCKTPRSDREANLIRRVSDVGF